MSMSTLHLLVQTFTSSPARSPGLARTHRRPGKASAVAAIFAMLLAVPALAATYRVGAGSGCTHSTIQAAVDAAAGNPGLDTVRITRSLNYTGQAVLVQADTAGIEFSGGYSDCVTNDVTAPRTIVSGNGGTADAVFSLRGAATVFMFNLDVTGGDNDAGGGGIEVIGGPKTIVLDDMTIRGNQGRYGGGISATNAVSNSTDLQVIIDGDSSIVGNTSSETGFQFGGGGLYCENASVRVTGASYFLGNTSGNYGGGIAAHQCAVDIGSTGLLGGVLLGNSAAHDGGALHASSSRSVVDIYTVDPQSPASILGNTAGDDGGAIMVFTNASVSLYDSIVGNNVARRGGAIAIDDVDGSPSITRFLMQGTTLGAPATARNCAERERCNRISGNLAANASGVAEGGAALFLRGGNEYTAVATLRGTRVDSNNGRNLVDIDLDGDAAFDGALIEGNEVTESLFDVAGPHAENVVLAATTIAGNALGTGHPVILARNVCAIDGPIYRGAHAYRSIVWQPGHALVAMNGTPDLDCFQFLLGNDLGPLPASSLNVVGDPMFVDTASGDFRLPATSPALDFAVAQPVNSTRDRGRRVIDDPAVANFAGPQDLGAYEMDFDPIFSDGFDG